MAFQPAPNAIKNLASAMSARYARECRPLFLSVEGCANGTLASTQTTRPDITIRPAKGAPGISVAFLGRQSVVCLDGFALAHHLEYVIAEILVWNEKQNENARKYCLGK